MNAPLLPSLKKHPFFTIRYLTYYQILISSDIIISQNLSNNPNVCFYQSFTTPCDIPKASNISLITQSSISTSINSSHYSLAYNRDCGAENSFNYCEYQITGQAWLSRNTIKSSYGQGAKAETEILFALSIFIDNNIIHTKYQDISLIY